ncbi:MAG: hypothetical protein ACUVTG_16380, partial [Candidatus Oleimicrobiaceae bacterium]
TTAPSFERYLLSQFTHYVVELSQVIIQTDNGSEFIGSVQKRRRKSAFIRVSEDAGVKQARVPPRACTWQSDVEAFHKMIEDQFYDIGDYREGLSLGQKLMLTSSASILSVRVDTRGEKP